MAPPNVVVAFARVKIVDETREFPDSIAHYGTVFREESETQPILSWRRRGSCVDIGSQRNRPI